MYSAKKDLSQIIYSFMLQASFFVSSEELKTLNHSADTGLQG